MILREWRIMTEVRYEDKPVLERQKEHLEKAIGHLYFYMEQSKHGGKIAGEAARDSFTKLAQYFKDEYNMGWWE